MTHPVYKFKQNDICRAVKGVKNAGIDIGKIELASNGHIIISTTNNVEAMNSPLDEWKEKHGFKFKRDS